MKIYCNQLRQYLKGGLAPIYLLVGDEPLQKMEAGDLIRRAALRAGHANTRLFFITQDGDWDAFRQSLGSHSLFSEKSLFDIHLNSAPSKAGVAALKLCAENPRDDMVILIRANRLDARLAWVKKMTERGMLVQIYGKNLAEMKAWTRERMLRAGLKVEDQVADIVAERLEGNLLAAAQEIDKLALLYGDQLVRQEHVMAALNERSLYNGFDFADAVVSGDGARAVRIMRSLQSAGQPLVLVVNALASQLRSLIEMETKIAHGEAANQLLARVWRSKRAVFATALARGRGERFWRNGLRWCAEVDKAIKGLSVNEEWGILLDATLYLARRRPPAMVTSARP